MIRPTALVSRFTSTHPSAALAALLSACVLTAAACTGGEESKPAATAAPEAAAPAAEAPAPAAPSKVVTTASGLQYQVITAGSGKSPATTDSVTVHYRGTLQDGTEFDSSHKRGEPATFPLNRVIKGWTEGLQLMKEGATYKFTIPPDLAYGKRGAGALIGPDATLNFEVELISVN